MPRTLKPGRLWWIWTCTVGAFKPGVGKHRINAKMKELVREVEERGEQLDVRNSDIEFLREELHREQEANRRLKAALYIEEGVNTLSAARNHEVPAEEVDTQRIPVVSTN